MREEKQKLLKELETVEAKSKDSKQVLEAQVQKLQTTIEELQKSATATKLEE